MTRSNVQRKLASYVTAQENLSDRRASLRAAVLDWKDKGATIVEIAETLSWSRQSVYDLIDRPRGPQGG